MQLLERNIRNARSSTAKGLWKMSQYPPCAGYVWSPGTQESIQRSPMTPNEWGARWWPVVISTYVEPGSLQMWVLCGPLIEQECKTPWETHASRILMEPLIAEPERVVIGPSTVTIEEVDENDETAAADDWVIVPAAATPGSGSSTSRDAWSAYVPGYWQTDKDFQAYVLENEYERAAELLRKL